MEILKLAELITVKKYRSQLSPIFLFLIVIPLFAGCLDVVVAQVDELLSTPPTPIPTPTAIALLAPMQAATGIELANPGNFQDLQPALQSAIDTAADGDTIILPAGEFFIDGRIFVDKFISIRGQGRDDGGTKLYRRDDVSDETLAGQDGWKFMFDFHCTSPASSHIVIADIYFKGKTPSLVENDGGSIVSDYGIRLSGCIDFLVVNNRFEHFGHAGVSVEHDDRLAKGLISHNEFIHNLKVNPQETRGTTPGYGVTVAGVGAGDWVEDPQFGSDNFIFIEDNYFFEQRHAVAGASKGLYVFRYNIVKDNLFGHAVDAHGGGNFDNDFSTRAYEVYNNHIFNSRYQTGQSLNQAPSASVCNDLAYRAMYFRGGEGLVYDNTIAGFRHGIGITTEITGDYPVVSQIGYRSALSFGPNQTNWALPEGDGDIFEWNNNFAPYTRDACIEKFRNFQESLLFQSRDYHLNTRKPNYTPFNYPHPLLNRR